MSDQFLIDTDILVDHLVHNGNGKSSLEKLMKCGICFTTVINSAEIYFAVRNIEEKNAVDSLMKAVKVLGLHARYSLLVNEYSTKLKSVRDSLFCATAKINKLVIVTGNAERYKRSNLNVSEPKNL